MRVLRLPSVLQPLLGRIAVLMAGGVRNARQGVVRGASALNSLGARIVQIRWTNTRGTTDPGDVTIEQVPAAWLRHGRRRRALEHGRRAVRNRPGVVRADKTSTVVWMA